MNRLGGVIIALLLIGCAEPESESQRSSEAGVQVVTISAFDHAFGMPGSIQSGWTLFEMPNRGTELHVAVFERLPEGITWQDWLDAKEIDPRPEWTKEIVTVGGVGAVSEGNTARTILNLPPGVYVVGCGARTSEGHSHHTLGMQTPLIVSDSGLQQEPPLRDYTLTITNSQFDFPTQISAGVSIIGVDFVEQTQPDHDAHLVRLNSETQLREVVEYLGHVKAPAPATFLGGIEQLSSGHSGFVEVDLKPGKYAWVCHFHASKGMVFEFEVV